MSERNEAAQTADVYTVSEKPTGQLRWRRFTLGDGEANSAVLEQEWVIDGPEIYKLEWRPVPHVEPDA